MSAGHFPGNDGMRVLVTSTSYPSSIADWRGIFIRNLVEALARRPDIKLALWAPPGDCTGDVRRVSLPFEDRYLAELMRQGGIAHLLRTHPGKGLLTAARLLWGLGMAYRRTNIDVYHANWLQSAIPLPRNGRPLLVTVLGSDMQLLRAPLIRPLLKRAFRGRSVIICPNAEWMVEPLQAVFGPHARIVAVPFGIEPRWFAVSRASARKHDDAGDWLVVSRITRGKLGSLVEWGEPLFNGSRRRLHLFGPMQETVKLPAWIIQHGATTPDVLCAEWFPRATGLITLSQHAEGRPQVMLEAMASGLPIIASRLPAHENLIDETTGRLVGDPDQFARAVEELEQPDLNLALGIHARDRARSIAGTWDDCAERFEALYRQLLQESGS